MVPFLPTQIVSESAVLNLFIRHNRHVFYVYVKTQNLLFHGGRCNRSSEVTEHHDDSTLSVLFVIYM